MTNLAELRSEGQRFYAINWNPPSSLRQGATGEKVRQLQYMLSILASFIPEIPPISVDGVFGSATRAAVLASQRRFRLPETGVVDARTWDEIYDQYSGIENTSLRSRETFPTTENGNNRPATYARASTMRQFPGFDLRTGQQDPIKQEVIR